MPEPYTVTIDLPIHKVKDKWIGIGTIGPILVAGVTPSATLSRVRMTLKKRTNVFILDSESGDDVDAPITIVNGTTWEASIPEVQDFVLLDGDWNWDMEFYAGSDTSPQTFYEGILTVTPDV